MDRAGRVLAADVATKTVYMDRQAAIDATCAAADAAFAQFTIVTQGREADPQ